MISKSIQSSKEAIYHDLQQCRRGTFKLFADIDHDTFCSQAHPDFSPVGWHLGHIAYTEDLWLLQRCAGLKPVFPEYHQLFAADILPKTQRVFLPAFPEVEFYLDAVRKNVLDYLEVAPIEQQERLWRFMIQHESQHCETVAFVLQMVQKEEGRLATDFVADVTDVTDRRRLGADFVADVTDVTDRRRLGADFVADLTDVTDRIKKAAGRLITDSELPITDSELPIPNYQFPITDSPAIAIPGGEFYMGSDAAEALDNERSRHLCYLEAYAIDRYPVTCGQYRDFMTSGGYQNHDWWSAEGWEWQKVHLVDRPLYWSENPAFSNHPVCGVSWYEAEAYCNFIGKRLPSEAEWEKAASWDATNQTKLTYPWGETRPNASLCNHGNHLANTSPVDTFPEGASAIGCCDMLGNVWEWTASTFDAYPEFESYPYKGYSELYFDGEHRVLKGGSWATFPQAMRSTFRNWYYPGVRQIIAGFRCAK
ncbi:SUMF1/EgtB/PvdO family nonheme iron enzyme [Lyngbya sp. CCAP 1446/10]|uniref:SUMF1/EgtB/PvdO family nonheme iron enzyme n=1 Tax=Lyngbya sp. CCAP 1446/10 TaxID=439293 RepID=UPI002237C2D8|nr:SUMF1/EgtB/PvdO family nonheme iron enzyme [Lyngbya sp. CCAP 1446/10]MCW6049723.1 SUMF1/EgtB/PvdO family nonheme iron enzyme [Lyngbya sp. CCAP 1446/10]